MRSKALFGGLVASVLLLAGAAFASRPSSPPAEPAPATAPSSTAPAHSLDAQDVNAWLDGFLPYALKTGDIAGAVVVVVKDGQVLTERGFGVSDEKTQAPVDPDRTLFRPGSISKLFTWTAVMQQVEAGKLNLDQDVNVYLDFRIPPHDGKPVTLRNLMTHTPGFEEAIKHLFYVGKGRPDLGAHLKAWVPARIFPPGEVPAYSNYGAALAGYIVERVSGEEFDAYVARHIFQPLGMARSTFDQPLPSALAPDMSKGYLKGSGDAQPFEMVSIAPAGALSTTGSDIARFMIAHLQDGRYGEARILKPETARMMHAPQLSVIPAFAGMALGFYHEDRNGHVIVGHGGDTEAFHSDLHLFLNDGVGLYVSFNSLGADAAAAKARSLLLQGFVERYFPASPGDAPALASARRDATVMAGTYISSRRSDSNFLRLLPLLSEAHVVAKPDGTLTIDQFKTPGGAQWTWRETAPFVWRQVHGRGRLGAVVKDGKVTAIGVEGAPIAVLQPATGVYAPWNLALLQVSLLTLVAAAVLWPVSALVRRRYGVRFALEGRPAVLYRLVRVVAMVDVALAAGWVVLLSVMEQDLSLLNDGVDPWLRLMQALGAIGAAGGLIGVLNLLAVWSDRSRGWWAKLSSLLLAVATLSVIWFVFALRLVTPSLNF
jgi:CubicO group peptidase (beta-lactamase class C family)